MDIRGYLQTSLNEWPGKIAAVVWVPGCNFRCPFCDNRQLVLRPEKLPQIAEEEIFADLEKRKEWVDAVVISGGEPSLQKDLSRFLNRCKRMDFLTMIETNGTGPETMAKLLNGQMVDRITMDIKAPLDRYAQITKSQIPISKIKESMKLIINSGVDFEFRTTVVPTLHDKANLVKLAKQLKKIAMKQLNNKTIEQLSWYLQQFVPQNCLDLEFEKIKPFSKKKMEEILEAVKKYVPGARLRGV